MAKGKDDSSGGESESLQELSNGAASQTQDTYDHPSTKIWSVYMAEVIPHDKALVESWSKDMDGILIFAGLFSASVTAFIIESYNGLMPDPTIVLLQQISQQLDGKALLNQTAASAPFIPTPSSLRVNAFWFISLCFALTCALAATLVQQWSRNYLQAIERRPAPYVQARIRSYLYEGIEKFKMTAVVEGIPTLLHASVFFFFAGLVDFLYSINRQVAWVTLAVVAACGTLYLLITILPVVHRQSPFQTPLSKLFWIFCRFLGLLRYRSDNKWKRLRGSMWQGREVAARAVCPGLIDRDVDALSWTLKNLTEDKELVPFVEGILAFCTSEDGPLVMNKVLMNKEAQLLSRIIALLHTCDKFGSLTPLVRRVRSITCLNAITKLCQIFANPWDLLSTHEQSLRGLLIPMTMDSDQPVADAAMNAVASVVEHMHNCVLLHARQFTHHAYRDQAARLACTNSMGKKFKPNFSGYTGEFDWAFNMFDAWDALDFLAEIIPGIESSPHLTHTHGPFETVRASIHPEFKDALYWFFIKHHSTDRPNHWTTADLSIKNRAHRRAVAFLSATFYTADRVATTYPVPQGFRIDLYGITDTTGVPWEISRLDALSVHCTSKLVSKYATCVLIHMATFFQRNIFRDCTGALLFGRLVSNEDMKPIRNQPSQNYHLPLDWGISKEVGVRTTRLFAKLLPAERLHLSILSDTDRARSMFLCRGHIHLLIALLGPFCALSREDEDVLVLANRAISNMLPYLDARFSCRRDQRQLVDLCKTVFDSQEHESMAGRPLCRAFIDQLLGVLSTIGDPCLLDAARCAIGSARLNHKHDGHVNAALLKLNSATPLEPLEDDSDPRDEDPAESAQATGPSQTFVSGNGIYLQQQTAETNHAAPPITVQAVQEGLGTRKTSENEG